MSFWQVSLSSLLCFGLPRQGSLTEGEGLVRLTTFFNWFHQMQKMSVHRICADVMSADEVSADAMSIAKMSVATMSAAKMPIAKMSVDKTSDRRTD